MIYFKGFAIVMGIITIGVRFLMHLIPEKWNKFELETAYKVEKPKWIWYAAILSIIIVAFTWYKELTTDVSYSIVLTIVVTLTLIKISQLLFNYENFRKFAHRALVEDRSLIVKINIATTILGIILIGLGLFVY